MQQTKGLLDLRKEWGPSDAIRAKQEGRCLGLAEALATLLNPYAPNVDEVRRETMRRIRAAPSV